MHTCFDKSGSSVFHLTDMGTPVLFSAVCRLAGEVLQRRFEDSTGRVAAYRCEGRLVRPQITLTPVLPSLFPYVYIPDNDVAFG
jgi:hypothetical protein